MRFNAPPMSAMTIMTSVATPASSRIASRIPAAAVGMMNGRPGRPDVTFSAMAVPTRISPMSSRALLRCQYCGRNRHTQPKIRPTTRTARNSQPPRRATSGRALRRPNSSIVSSWVAVTFSPLRTIVSFAATWTRYGGTRSACLLRSCSVRTALKVEFGSMSGEMISAARVRSSGASPPAIWPDSWAWTSATSESRSSPRSVASRTREDSARTAVQRSGVSARRVALADGSMSGRASSRSAARSSTGVVSAKARSIGRTRSSNARSCLSAAALALAVLKS